MSEELEMFAIESPHHMQLVALLENSIVFCSLIFVFLLSESSITNQKFKAILCLYEKPRYCVLHRVVFTGPPLC